MDHIELDFLMAEMMMKVGGSFVSTLGQLWFKADATNRAKIVAAWPDYCAKYRELARLRRTRITEEIERGS